MSFLRRMRHLGTCLLTGAALTMISHGAFLTKGTTTIVYTVYLDQSFKKVQNDIPYFFVDVYLIVQNEIWFLLRIKK